MRHFRFVREFKRAGFYAIHSRERLRLVRPDLWKRAFPASSLMFVSSQVRRRCFLAFVYMYAVNCTSSPRNRVFCYEVA